MTLRQQQSKFAHDVALLLLYAYAKGYEVTFGDAARMGHLAACPYRVRGRPAQGVHRPSAR